MGEISDYVSTLDGAERAAVEHVIARARRLVPDADEGRSYGMPALRYRGSPLLSVQVTASHIGLYPFSPGVIESLTAELSTFDRSKGTIRFQPDRPLPDDVLDLLVLARRDEIDAKSERQPGS
jgi:uncharacterized protein YdhG (YjbR/CyaY superfamily)